jgi:hypothetical protein
MISLFVFMRLPSSEILDQGRNSALLLGSFAQNSFESGVEISPHLCNSLIAILAKERRWPVIFEDSTALLVLEQNDS